MEERLQMHRQIPLVRGCESDLRILQRTVCMGVLCCITTTFEADPQVYAALGVD
jgi:hypothetical protein